MTCSNPDCSCNLSLGDMAEIYYKEELNKRIDNIRMNQQSIVVPLTNPAPDTNLQEVYKVDGQILKEGAKKDDGKFKWELLAFDALEGIAAILTMGAKKYSARNWELGIMYGRVFGAIMRHLSAWWRGESIDAESGRSHLDHAMCELMFLSAYEKRGMTKFDDRPGK